MDRDWIITVETALKRPVFKSAKVVAGSQGLSNPVRWVHILENPEGTAFLNGGELVLSSGVNLGRDATTRLLYFTRLIQSHAAGLCIELEPYMHHIPADMLELADHHKFPLIVFEQQISFVNITLDLHESIISKHNQTLRELEIYAHDLQKLTLQTPNLHKILRHFQKKVCTQTFFATVDEPPLFSPSMPQGVESEIAELLKRGLLSSPAFPETSGIIPVSDRKKVLYQPIMAMGHILAYLGVFLYKDEPDEILSLTLEYTVTAIAQVLLRKMFAEERALVNHNRLIEDILQDKIRDEEQIRKVLGINTQVSRLPSYWTAILEIQNEKPRYMEITGSPFHGLLPVVRSVFLRHLFKPILLSKGHRLYIILLETSDLSNYREQLHKALTEIENICRQSLDLDSGSLRYGISGHSDQYANAYHSFQEAELVLNFSEQFKSPFFKDLGIFRLLLQIKDSYALKSFIEDYLGPLIRYDEKHQGQLMLTLRVFLDCGLSKQEASERLYIHRQTFYNRLEKIQELLGEEYFLSENLFCLQLALRTYEWVNKKSCLKG